MFGLVVELGDGGLDLVEGLVDGVGFEVFVESAGGGVLGGGGVGGGVGGVAGFEVVEGGEGLVELVVGVDEDGEGLAVESVELCGGHGVSFHQMSGCWDGVGWGVVVWSVRCATLKGGAAPP